jgi:hypothetical protein
MLPRWVLLLAFLFVLFLIYTEPGGAGQIASGFANFLVTLLGSIGEFLTGLFEGASRGSDIQGSGFGRSGTTSTILSDDYSHLLEDSHAGG